MISNDPQVKGIVLISAFLFSTLIAAIVITNQLKIGSKSKSKEFYTNKVYSIDGTIKNFTTLDVGHWARMEIEFEEKDLPTFIGIANQHIPFRKEWKYKIEFHPHKDAGNSATQYGFIKSYQGHDPVNTARPVHSNN